MTGAALFVRAAELEVDSTLVVDMMAREGVVAAAAQEGGGRGDGGLGGSGKKNA